MSPEVQHLKFCVYDRDTPSSNLAEQDLIGVCEVNLAKIMGARVPPKLPLALPGTGLLRGYLEVNNFF